MARRILREGPVAAAGERFVLVRSRAMGREDGDRRAGPRRGALIAGCVVVGRAVVAAGARRPWPRSGRLAAARRRGHRLAARASPSPPSATPGSPALVAARHPSTRAPRSRSASLRRRSPSRSWVAARSTLADLRGKPVWVMFMASWCPPCQDELPIMNGFAARYARDWPPVVLPIDVREPEADVQAFMRDRLDVHVPVGLDPDGDRGRRTGAPSCPRSTSGSTRRASSGTARWAASGRTSWSRPSKVTCPASTSSPRRRRQAWPTAARRCSTMESIDAREQAQREVSEHGRDAEPGPDQPAVGERGRLGRRLAHEHVDGDAQVVERGDRGVEDREDGEDDERRAGPSRPPR